MFIFNRSLQTTLVVQIFASFWDFMYSKSFLILSSSTSKILSECRGFLSLSRNQWNSSQVDEVRSFLESVKADSFSYVKISLYLSTFSVLKLRRFDHEMRSSAFYM
jgi:hypothetical protein